MEQENY